MHKLTRSLKIIEVKMIIFYLISKRYSVAINNRIIFANFGNDDDFSYMMMEFLTSNYNYLFLETNSHG